MSNIHKVFIVGLLVMLPAATFAAATSTATTYTIVRGDTFNNIALKNNLSVAQLQALNPQITNIHKIRAGKVLVIATSTVQVTTPSTTPTTPVPKPATTTPTAQVSTEERFAAYITGYAWPDNTPAGSDISNGVIHTQAGGTGTHADPITLAVGHSIINGKDILDYPKGTKFYMPNLQKYFIVEDTCGDGNAPQNGPCHTGHNGSVWLDIWVGGLTGAKADVLACEEAITDMHLMIKNPAANYKVVPGAVYGTSCATQYGDTVITQ